jgi:hypothetical protein
MTDYPKKCDLCGCMIESNEDLDWHGYGNCVEITDEMLEQWEKEAKEPTAVEKANAEAAWLKQFQADMKADTERVLEDTKVEHKEPKA